MYSQQVTITSVVYNPFCTNTVILFFTILQCRRCVLIKHGNARAPAGHICKKHKTWKRALKCKYHSGSYIKIPLPQIYALIKFYLSSLMLQKHLSHSLFISIFFNSLYLFCVQRNDKIFRWTLDSFLLIALPLCSIYYQLYIFLFQLQSFLNLKMGAGRKSDLITPDYLISLL